MKRDWLRYISSGLLGLGLGGAATHVFHRRIKAPDQGQTDVLFALAFSVYLTLAERPGNAGRNQQQDLDLSHPCLKYGLPSTDNLRLHKNFVLSFDSRTRNAKWVLEHITKDSSSGTGSRADVRFFEDTGLEPRFRSRLEDYRNSGYDRGHLAPAANHKGDQAALTQTFSMSNMSPQVGKGFNRDYWARFERFVKQLAWSSDEVFIVTGPLWVPQKTHQGYVMHHPMIGKPPRFVAVPTHFYKVVLSESRSRLPFSSPKVAVGAFVMPNDQIQPDAPLTAFTVHLEMLEDVAGMKFFPAYVNDARRQALDAAALRWNQIGQSQKKYMKFGDRSQLQGGMLMLEAPTPPAIAQKGRQAHNRTPLITGADSCFSPPGSTNAQVNGMIMPQSGADMLHICDAVECKLPAEDWFESKKKQSKPVAKL